MCDQIAIINHGQIVANEDKTQLMKRLNQNCVQILFNKKPKSSLFSKIEAEFQFKDQTLCLKHTPDQNALDQVIKLASQEGYIIQDITTYKPGLEEIFLSIVNQAS